MKIRKTSQVNHKRLIILFYYGFYAYIVALTPDPRSRGLRCAKAAPAPGRPRPRAASCARRAWRPIFCSFAPRCPALRLSLARKPRRSSVMADRAARRPAVCRKRWRRRAKSSARRTVITPLARVSKVRTRCSQYTPGHARGVEPLQV